MKHLTIRLTQQRISHYLLGVVLLVASITAPTISVADDYVIDTKGAHAFVQFRVKHLGYSWLYGRFNSFEGEFSYDPKKPNASTVDITVDMTSLDTNHAERETHLAAPKYLNSGKYTTASFKSTAYKAIGDKTAVLTGDLTFMGVTKSINIDVEHIGGGADHWGGYRQGFEGKATITPKDFGLDMASKLGEAAAQVELILSVEGIRK
ncbi:YceI family protein [Teredinibacter purpureus]|uniref:YceI family protein n=1 Tax=Teredinibacter purpureus TaxID=2731756 RepID=UPI0009E41E9E|nr:YceI family protein [Teredinibacter purpureus]